MCVFTLSPLIKYKLVESSGRIYFAIHKGVASPLGKGLISVERVDAEYYRLTDAGLEIAEALAAKREAEVDSMLPS
ncbi:MAG: hypothetical protein QXL85_08125 [Candidatus Bathyarchaeia archaeon]